MFKISALSAFIILFYLNSILIHSVICKKNYYSINNQLMLNDANIITDNNDKNLP